MNDRWYTNGPGLIVGVERGVEKVLIKCVDRMCGWGLLMGWVDSGC